MFGNLLTASSLRSNLYNIIKDIVSTSKPIKVTSKGGNVVILSEDDYNSMQETFHLLKSPVNAMRLMESKAELEKGAGKILSPEDLED